MIRISLRILQEVGIPIVVMIGLFSSAVAQTTGGGHDPDDLPPIPPNVGGGVTGGGNCLEPDFQFFAECKAWRQKLEAWKLRQSGKTPKRAVQPTPLTASKTAQPTIAPAAKSSPSATPSDELPNHDYRQLDEFRVVSTVDVPIREQPDSKSAKLRDTVLNERLMAIGEKSDGWVLVAREGEPYGWIHGSALRRIVDERPKLQQATTFKPPPTSRIVERGQNHALIIGNNAYRNLAVLTTAISDAAALAELLKTKYTFEPHNVRLLLNADRRTIFEELTSLRERVDIDDRVLIYYAGHGQLDPVTGAGFWQPIDAERDKEYTWIPNDDVRRQLRGIPAKHVLVVADSCFSGTLTRNTPQIGSLQSTRYFEEVDAKVSRKAITSGGTEPVADSGTAGHSVFAYYFLRTLRRNSRPYVASVEVFTDLARAVTNNSSQSPSFGVVSDAGDEGGDFTFVLRK